MRANRLLVGRSNAVHLCSESLSPARRRRTDRVGVAFATGADATLFAGTLFCTTFQGGQNVWKINYSYNDATQSFNLGGPTNIASTPGADGIIFAPNGNLLIGGQGSNSVFEVNPNSGSIIHTQNVGTNSFHLALDPAGNKVYTSTFGGPLDTLTLPIGSGSTTSPVSGDDEGLTQLAFGTGGSVFYVNGNPHGSATSARTTSAPTRRRGSTRASGRRTV